jgi:hypothetical protein
MQLPYQLSPEEIAVALQSDHSDVRARFKLQFPDLHEQLLIAAQDAYTSFRGFSQDLQPDLRAAWVEAFAFAAYNAAMTSSNLLLAGLLIPSGNLMRHYGEATAMALLCAHTDTQVLEQIEKDRRYNVQRAVAKVKQAKNRRRLRIDAKGWETFERITSWYDQYSHSSVFAVASLHINAGGMTLITEFDEGKTGSYAGELTLRASAFRKLRDLVPNLNQLVREAQAEGLITSHPN